ncbi:MAG: RNase adapter RapZ [Dermatophilaceae bacterium]
MLIITGMSGAGRSTAAKVLEDLGWFVVDNLPAQLLSHVQSLRTRESGGPRRVAAVIDARSRGLSTTLSEILAELRSSSSPPVVVFLDATDEALVRRFESVRRPHPMQGNGRLLDGITAERELMSELRASADLLVDTSGLNVHQLSAKIASMLHASLSSRTRLAVMSFGFKYGVPLDADFVMDMRFLPNPFWVPELRAHNGKDADVAAFVLGQEGAQEVLDLATRLLDAVTAGYQREGRRYATVAVGCTGGKHRSVAMAEALAARLTEDPTIDPFVVHRDLGRE